MTESILTSIKKLLGIMEEDKSFDADLIIFINSAFSILTQIGIGPVSGYRIEDKNDVWSEIIPNDKSLEDIKEYVFIKVKLVFDPPLSSSTLSAYKETLRELEFRINASVDHNKEQMEV